MALKKSHKCLTVFVRHLFKNSIRLWETYLEPKVTLMAVDNISFLASIPVKLINERCNHVGNYTQQS